MASSRRATSLILVSEKKRMRSSLEITGRHSKDQFSGDSKGKVFTIDGWCPCQEIFELVQFAEDARH